ncbi:hypothetical protein VTN77DRAFT_5969 [Rasamsonia byssochlamydoides]|uniref:uncharacterized protein n=1 Tax=Rasamsonia byssochlamydoides TaxID=89139 RepID=UPI00374365B4
MRGNGWPLWLCILSITISTRASNVGSIGGDSRPHSRRPPRILEPAGPAYHLHVASPPRQEDKVLHIGLLSINIHPSDELLSIILFPLLSS